MTPVLPMLAEACKSVAFALERCPNGMYSEIKYDGERVQVHNILREEDKNSHNRISIIQIKTWEQNSTKRIRKLGIFRFTLLRLMQNFRKFNQKNLSSICSL